MVKVEVVVVVVMIKFFKTIQSMAFGFYVSEVQSSKSSYSQLEVQLILSVALFGKKCFHN